LLAQDGVESVEGQYGEQNYKQQDSVDNYFACAVLGDSHGLFRYGTIGIMDMLGVFTYYAGEILTLLTAKRNCRRFVPR
jgi:hypothetical protein